jgi:xylulokinase
VGAIRSALDSAGVDGSDVAAVGLSGQMHGLVALDAAGEVLRPAILWNDQRTARECDEIREVVGADRLIAITGNDALPGFTAPKLLWVRRHEPDVWSRIAHVLVPKDLVRHRLTGELAIDRADGAGTLLFDLAARTWSREVVEALGIDPGWLPRSYEGPEVTGSISSGAAAATGLTPGTPVVAGGGDQASAAVGVGVLDPGVLSVSLGTSGVVFAATERPLIEPAGRLHAFCHAVPDRWHLMGVMLSAAGSLRWYRDTLAPGVGFDELVEEAAAVAPGADGLLFLPYLTGERTPHPDPLARGAFVGLTVRHTRGHLTRAVLEGVALGLRDSLELMRTIDLPDPDEARLTGGGSVSPLWCRIVADVLNLPVVTMETAEGAAHGAALLAQPAAGHASSIHEAVAGSVRTGPTIAPGPDAVGYGAVHERYRELYPALAPTFHAVAPEGG